LGHARTFLIAWWSARAQGGKVLLRIEDLDSARSDPSLIAASMRDLEWLGLDWDEAPYVQSAGDERLQVAISELLARGLAYACTCTRGDLRNAASAPQLGVTEIRYAGTCRDRYPTLAAARASGRAAGVRLRVPDGALSFNDLVRGEQAFDVQSEVGDFLIARRDGVPAYQLAVVVDDAFQGVTEVVRGDDLLASTPRQIWLERALALSEPRWAHVPLVVDAAGRRLAKREDALSLAELRARGIDPRRVVAWVAASAGMPLSEWITPGEALPAFQLDALPSNQVSTTTAEFLR
jgi:glutamyl-tRNA synthetase